MRCQELKAKPSTVRKDKYVNNSIKKFKKKKNVAAKLLYFVWYPRQLAQRDQFHENPLRVSGNSFQS